MIKRIKMPKYGLQQDEGTLVRWLKEEGDEISEGDVLCELETDKATFDFEVQDAGVLRKILCEAGRTVPVLSDIAVISDTADEPLDDPDDAPSESAEEPSASRPGKPDEPAATMDPRPPNRAGTSPRESGDGGASSRIRRSPAARKLAEDLDIDLATVTGTGPNGRIRRSDVQAAADALVSTASAPAPATGGREPLTRARKAIGRAMVEAKQTIPHFYLAVDIDATETEAAWKSLAASDRPDLTLTDIIVRAAADALKDYPILNARLDQDDVVYNDHVNIGLAVGTDDGLLVPVIESADTRSLEEVTRIRAGIVDAARRGKLTSDAPATFTISNLGMFGIREFSAIINPPECGALAVGALRDEVRPGTDPVGLLTRRVMTVTLSADHRLVDGLLCARFLNVLRDRLEDPSWL